MGSNIAERNNGSRVNIVDNRHPLEEDSSGGNINNILGVDDGLLDDDGPPVNKPDRFPDDPEDDNGEGTTGGRERPRYPSPRPTTPWTPVEPMNPPDPNVNNGINYSTKKTIAQGMMDIALLTANASQLRYIMRSPYWDVYHQANVILISISIALQVVVGIILIFIGHFDYTRKEDRRRPQAMNDVVVTMIFAITIVNIFIAAFGVDDERTTYLRWKTASSTEPVDPDKMPIHLLANHSLVTNP